MNSSGLASRTPTTCDTCTPTSSGYKPRLHRKAEVAPRQTRRGLSLASLGRVARTLSASLGLLAADRELRRARICTTEDQCPHGPLLSVQIRPPSATGRPPDANKRAPSPSAGLHFAAAAHLSFPLARRDESLWSSTRVSRARPARTMASRWSYHAACGQT